MKKTILVIGGSGFIGSNFLRFASNTSNPLIYNIVAPSHKVLDIVDRRKLKRIFKAIRPQIVINFAAHRNANTAELQRGDMHGTAWQTNVRGVRNISQMSRLYESYLIHFSTDMVFAGHKKNPGPYHEMAIPEKDPKKLSWYGWTKKLGELELIDNKNVAIVRIGNVTQPTYDPAVDYVGKIVYLYDKHALYPLFSDQFISLTPIQSVNDVLRKLVNTKKPGIFHVASTDRFTPFILGAYVIKKTRRKIREINQVSIKTFHNNFNRYPQYGGLLTQKTQKELGVKFLDWKDIIDKSVAKLMK